jgi:hypothetical protein
LEKSVQRLRYNPQMRKVFAFCSDEGGRSSKGEDWRGRIHEHSYQLVGNSIEGLLSDFYENAERNRSKLQEVEC